VRAALLRTLAALFTGSWLIVPGFAVPDLLVTWDEDWPVMLEGGWAMFSGVLVAAAFAAAALRPRRCAPAIVLLWVATATLAVSTVAAAELPLLGLTGFLAAQAAVTTALARSLPGAERLRPALMRPAVPLLALGVAGIVPWAAYAVAMWRANRTGTPFDVTMGIDHFSVQGALAIALPALAVLAGAWPRGRVHLGVAAGLAAGYVGLGSWAWPGTAAGFGATWSVLGVAWGVAVAGSAVVAGRLRTVPRPDPVL
jgi:hypothetical protein